MIERFLFELAPGWALKADNQQWLICRRKMDKGTVKWRPVSFIGSTRAVLISVLGQKGIIPTPEVRTLLTALPERFLDWRDSPQMRRAA
jgi:hypothetical protein|tara:strand:+ start:842 stop:1108 length:267 start_codon:yes stop_codon:yes gene_type:complete